MIEEYLRPECARGTMPGAAWQVERGGRIASSGCTGLLARLPAPEPARPDALYDLASLTKVLATAPLAILLARHGDLDLLAPLGTLLPEFRGGPREQCTLRDCLTHTAGFPAWIPLPARASGPDQVVPLLGALAEGTPPGSRVEYSDLGFLTVEAAIQRTAGLPLDALFERHLAAPLGLGDIGFRPAASETPRIAPTEMAGNAHESARAAECCGEEARTRYRTRPLRGEVNDGNTWFLGGVSGAAGLFGTAPAVAALAREFLGGDASACRRSGARGLFRPGEIRLLTTSATPALEGKRTLGFECASNPGSSAGPALSPEAIGHTGFTGTSLWIDPRPGAIFVLLTNRIHPEVPATPFHPVRRAFHAHASRV